MRTSLTSLLSLGTALLGLACAFPAQAYDVHTKALVPVKFQTAPRHSALPLIKEGKLNFALAFDHQLEKQGYWDRKSIRPAIAVLQEALEHCTGQKVLVIDTNDQAAMAKQPYLILVGDSAPARKLGLNFRKMPEQGYEIKTFPRGIAIVGNDSSLIKDSLHKPLRGTLWGVYDFIERFLGCRFYFPGEAGSIWPKTDSLTVTPVHYADSPRFITRNQCWINWSMRKHKTLWESLLGPYRKGTCYPDKVPFYERWRLATPTAFWASHNPRPVPLAKAYPDKLETIFYRAPNGTHYYAPNQHHGNYFNVLDLNFADLLVDSLKKYYATNGKQNDGWACLSKEFIPFGQCDFGVPVINMINHPTVIKEKLISEENLKNGGGEYSEIYGRFHQYLAQRLKKEFPDKKVLLLPYSGYTLAPKDPRWTLPDNVELRVCVYGMAKIRDPKVAAQWKKIMDDWYRALGNRPIASIWLYNVPRNQFARAIAPMLAKDVIKLFGKTLGNEDIFHDQYGGLEWWHYCANYVHARTTWSEDFDGMAAIDEHWNLMYGPKAGPLLKEFFQLVYDSYMKYFVPSPERVVLYPAPVIDRMEALLKKAGTLLPADSLEMKRYRVFSYPWKDAIDTQRNLMSYERPVHGLQQVPQGVSVAIDGKADAFWSRIRPLPLRDPTGSNAKPKTPITAKLAWNNQGIYCLAKMDYKPINNGKQPVWNSDGLEFFVCPTMKDHHLFHLSVDSLGREYFGTQEFYPVDKPYTQWKCKGVKSAVSQNGDASWTIEFFMPFTSMGYPAPKAYDSWRINFVQNRRTDFKESAGSAITNGHNKTRGMFGLIKFLGRGE